MNDLLQRFLKYFCLIFLFIPSPDIYAVESLQPNINNVKIDNIQSYIEGINRQGIVHSVAFSFDGRSIAAASNDSIIYLWDRYTGKEIVRFRGHTGKINAICFGPNNKTIASCSNDRTVRLWDINTGQEINRFLGHTKKITSIAYNKKGTIIASGSEDKTIKLWDLKSKDLIKQFIGFGRVFSIVFNQNDNYLVAGCMSNIVVWDLSSGKAVKQITGQLRRISSLIFNSSGTLLISGAWDGTIRIWDFDSGKEINLFSGHISPIHTVCINKKENLICSASFDRTFRVWNLATGKEMYSSKRFTNSISFSPDGSEIAFAGKGIGVIEINDLGTNKERKYEGNYKEITCLAFSNDGRYIITGHRDGGLHLWDSFSGEELYRFMDLKSIRSVCFNSDDKDIIYSNGVVIYKLNIENETKIKILKRNKYRKIISIQAVDTDLVYAFGKKSGENKFRLFNVQNEKIITEFKGHGKPGRIRDIIDICVSPDNTKVASSSTDKTVKIWNYNTGDEISSISGLNSTVFSMDFSPKGNVLALGLSDGTVSFRNIHSGDEVYNIVSEEPKPRVCFNHNGTNYVLTRKDILTVYKNNHFVRRMVAGNHGNWITFDNNNINVGFNGGSLFLGENIKELLNKH